MGTFVSVVLGEGHILQGQAGMLKLKPSILLAAFNGDSVFDKKLVLR